MSQKLRDWRYLPTVDRARTAKLNAIHHFETIIETLVGANVEAYEWESARDQRLKGLGRASFLLKVASGDYDAFFNSPAGYRAQYALSASNGQARNREILDRLELSLIDFASNNGEDDLYRVAASLRGVGAKIWIYEKEVADQMGGSEHAIHYPPWESYEESDAGLFAPVGTMLEVKGGWLDNECVEHPDPVKSMRSSEIHNYGYS